MKRQTDPYGKAFSFTFIFLLAPEEYWAIFLLHRLAVRISLKFKTWA